MAVLDSSSVPKILLVAGDKISQKERDALQIFRNFPVISSLGDIYCIHPLVQLYALSYNAVNDAARANLLHQVARFED